MNDDKNPWQVRFERERKARKEAEKLLEQKSFELWKANQNLEKKVQERTKSLEEALKTKDDFLANMSHELKTPLNSINVISAVMKKNKTENLTLKQVENLEVINTCGKNLLELINDVLDISKLEAGEITVNFETFCLKKVLKDIELLFKPLAKQKNINLILNNNSKHELIHSDETRLKQILKNFLSNSIKFAQNGNIELAVLDEGENILFKVIDDGIGIKKEKLEHIFERFKQVDSSTTRKYGGTGLGLAISKELSLLLDGDIDVQSIEGKGSTFSLKIPTNSEKIEKGEHHFRMSHSNEKKDITKKVLIFSNDVLNIMSLSIELKKHFGVEQVLSYQNYQKKELLDYDYVFIDYNSILENDINFVEKNSIILLDEEKEIKEEIKQNTKAVVLKSIKIDELLKLLK